MNPLMDAVREVLSHPQYMQVLGWAMALSMVVGALLNDGGKQLLTWTIAILTSVLVAEISRYMYWDAHGLVSLATMGTAITATSTLVTIVGLSIGWLISYVAKHNARGDKPWLRFSLRDWFCRCEDFFSKRHP